MEAGLELPGFSTFDKMASKVRTEVNAAICEGIHDPSVRAAHPAGAAQRHGHGDRGTGRLGGNQASAPG